MENKERFLSIYREHIHREGSEKILDYLLSEHSDFFRAPVFTVHMPRDCWSTA